MERAIVEVGGRQYQVGRLPALTQLHVARRLMPCLAGLGKMSTKLQGLLPDKENSSDEASVDEALGEVMSAVGVALSGMSDEDVEYIVKACLKVCYFKQPTGWAPMMNAAGMIMDSNLQLPDLIRVTVEVIKENLGGFFTGAPPSPEGQAAA